MSLTASITAIGMRVMYLVQMSACGSRFSQEMAICRKSEVQPSFFLVKHRVTQDMWTMFDASVSKLKLIRSQVHNG